MKPSILIATLLIFGLSFNAFSQTQPAKPDTAKKPVTTAPAPAKPEYKPDPAKVFHITLDLTGPEIFSLTSGLDGTLHRNPQLSGLQVGDMEDDNKAFAKNIRSQAGAQQEVDYKKWQADTAAKTKPVPIRKQK